MSTPVLETPRLRLRPLVSYDAQDIQRQFPQWEIVRFMAANRVPWPYPADGARQYLTGRLLPAMQTGSRFGWAITLKARLDDALIGVITLKPDREACNRGFWIGEDWQGRGYMTEASFAVNDFAFAALALPELLFTSADSNTPSIRLKERSGATCIQHGEFAFHAGVLPISRWRLTAKDWQVHRSDVWKSLGEKAKVVQPAAAAEFCQKSKA
jgi:ribosomal-protein-alanine N-acetyltransferase